MYLADILNPDNTTYKSGVVTLYVPDCSGNGNKYVIKGLIDQDIQFKMGVKWGSVIPNFETISDISQIINSQNVYSWVSSSTGAWKGTDPFTFNLTFYLVTYSRHMRESIKLQASRLAGLCALYTENDSLVKTTVHGGYKLNLADANGTGRNRWWDKKFNLKSNKIDELLQEQQGLITMYLGDAMVIDMLLIENVAITPSSAQVAPGVPLFIKIDASFRTHRALLAKDVERFFNS